MASPSAPDLRAVVDAAADSSAALLIGVRHHSPLLAAAVPTLLSRWQPSHILVELPTDFTRWLGPLGDPQLTAPVALSASLPDGGVAHYPFADFSPELAVLRWAAAHGVPVEAIDLPLAQWPADRARGIGPSWSLQQSLEQAGRLGPGEDLWDRMVEAPGAGADPEALRRTALAVGAAHRLETELNGSVSQLDQLRERWMADRVHACLRSGGRPAVMVGAFHGPALLTETPPSPEATAPVSVETVSVETVSVQPALVPTALLPYEFELLDSRSGYPSGVLDPAWQQMVWECGGDPARLRDAAAQLSVAATGHLRGQGHTSGVPDSREVLRMACDLAALRGLPAPGRQELVEAFSSCCAHGDVLGRGRAVAKALQATLVGRRRGILAPGAETAALADQVRQLLAELRLPGEGSPRQRVRLEPSRSPLDARRVVTLERLDVLGVPYGSRGDAPPSAVGVSWELAWTRSTSALLELRATQGATLAAAAEGALRSTWLRGEQTLTGCLRLLRDARRCQFPAVAALAVSSVPPLVGEATFAVQVRAVDELSGYADELADAGADVRRTADEVLEYAFGSVAGMGGSTELADAQALVSLALRSVGSDELSLRLRHELTAVARNASPVVEGALVVVELVLGTASAELLQQRVSGWVYAASSAETRRRLSARLAGLLGTGLEVIDDSVVFHALLSSVNGLADHDLLDRLPALRAGFDAVSPAGRRRLMGQLGSALDVTSAQLSTLADDPGRLAAWRRADLQASATVDALGLVP